MVTSIRHHSITLWAIYWPKATLALTFLLIFVFVYGLKGVQKDPSVDAFVPSNHPAAVNRDIAKDLFGLEDPVIVGLAPLESDTAFTPIHLATLREIDRQVRLLEGVKKNDVISLASENAISEKDGDLLVEPVIQAGSISTESARLAKERFDSMPMFKNILVSEGGDYLTVIIPVEDPNHAQEQLVAIKQLINMQAKGVFDVHIAGVAAMNARLAEIVDGDTRIFVPLAILTVLVILFVALRNPLGLLGPLLIIVGSAAIGIGLMGWLDAKYYLISTALPVVIMAIAVADSLHITTYYLGERAQKRSMTARQAAVIAIEKTWIPVTLTTITTVAAFIGLSFGAAMKPISEFGLFAAAGVAGACILSLTALPAILILTNLQPSNKIGSVARKSWVDDMVFKISVFAFERPVIALVIIILTIMSLTIFAFTAEFDYERQRYFADGDEVKTADANINKKLGGINFLDVVVGGSEEGILMTPSSLEAIAKLRTEIATLPYVVKVSAIDEYLQLMHKVLTGDDALPSKRRAPAQYMFLYESSAPPEDFKQEIDYLYSRALIRAQLSTDSYAKTLETVQMLETLIAGWSQKHQLDAKLSGRIAVNEGWMTLLAENHFRGLLMAVIIVFLTTIFVFRSLFYAFFSMVPVMVGVVTVYALMGALSIDIAPATSMTTAIATGLGIDFGIHLISNIRRRRSEGIKGVEVFSGSYLVVARACFYSALALGIALAVICISSAPPLRWFGLLVSIGAFGSLFGAIVIVPALWSSLFRKEQVIGSNASNH